MTEKKQYDLEDRLIRFSIRMLTIADLLLKTRAGNHIAVQLERCGTSPALNNGEAQALNQLKILFINLK